MKEEFLERVLATAAVVEKSAELGFHLCYGDFGHKYCVEPKDTALLVEIGNAIVKGVK